MVNVTRSGYEDERPRWARKGEVLLWTTDRHGARQQAGWPRESDVFAAFLTRKAWDRFRLDEAALRPARRAGEGGGGRRRRRRRQGEGRGGGLQGAEGSPTR